LPQHLFSEFAVLPKMRLETFRTFRTFRTRPQRTHQQRLAQASPSYAPSIHPRRHRHRTRRARARSAAILRRKSPLGAYGSRWPVRACRVRSLSTCLRRPIVVTRARSTARAIRTSKKRSLADHTQCSTSSAAPRLPHSPSDCCSRTRATFQHPRPAAPPICS
jgi:hypothetical protein